MIKLVTFLYFLASICNARPDVYVDSKNVITVPFNCPDGQSWVNGECRDVWRVEAAPTNVVTVPPNCPEGQEYINGQCRDVWLKTLMELNSFGRTQSNYENAEIVQTQNVVTVPTNCPPGQEWINGACRDVWRRSSNLMEKYINNLKNILSRNERQTEILDEVSNNNGPNKNVISVPNQCPVGYRPDALGICREIFN